MEKTEIFLTGWITEYIKNRNLIMRNLVEIRQDKNLLFVKFKDKEQLFIVKPFVKNYDFIKDFIKEEDDYVAIVIFNTNANFRAFVDTWDSLKRFKHLSVYFINPFSYPDKKWIVCPHTHSKISDEESIRIGLQSMFETVDTTDKSELEQKI